jgi:O-antigen/teichoic acid export membrane protein
MGSYALFGLLSSVGALLAFRVDTVMVASMTGTLNNGIYSIASFIVNVIEIPYHAVIVILTPFDCFRTYLARPRRIGRV